MLLVVFLPPHGSIISGSPGLLCCVVPWHGGPFCVPLFFVLFCRVPAGCMAGARTKHLGLGAGPECPPLVRSQECFRAAWGSKDT